MPQLKTAGPAPERSVDGGADHGRESYVAYNLRVRDLQADLPRYLTGQQDVLHDGMGLHTKVLLVTYWRMYQRSRLWS